MKKWLVSGLAGLTALCTALGLTGCVGPSSSGGRPSSSSSSSSSSGGTTTVWTMETAFAKATELGYSGSLEDFMETIQGKDGVGIQAIYVEEGVLYIQLTDGSTPINCGVIKGVDGKTPTFKVEDEKLYVSYDNGTTWSFLQDIREGLDGVGISSIEKTNTNGLVDTYKITYTDGNSVNFTVTNGEQGIQGIQGEPGKDGHTPVITIQNGYWYVDGVNTEQSAEGVKGDTGNGISSVTKTNTVGDVDTYTITYTDGTTTNFTVTNGKDGKDGSSIESIELTSSEGLVDTYTIKLTNGSETTFTVTNGAQGIQGIQGEKGADGHAPVVTIQNGYWYVDGVNTNQVASVKGDPGNGISSINKTGTSSDGLVDTYTITYSDGTTKMYTVTNGKDGENGSTPKFKAEDNNLFVSYDEGASWEYLQSIQAGVDGSSIKKIELTSTEGLVDTYTITLTDDTTTTFKVTNGSQGIQGIQGEKGADGHSPVITIQNGYWYIDGVNTTQSAKGVKGDTGNGISSIERTSSEGYVDTYTITYTSGVTTTFTVTNGKDGKDGSSIKSIEKTGSEGLVDTYTITLTDGSTTNFKVTNGANGANGEQGIQGIQGEKGEDGHTPVITIQNGYWYIDGENTTVRAEGLEGKAGNGISSIELTGTDGLVDTYTITFTDGKTTSYTVTNGKDGQDGAPGKDGVGVQSAYVEDGVLYVQLDDGSEPINCGQVVGQNGQNGQNGKDGVSVQTAYIEDGILYVQLNDGSAPINCGRVGVMDNDLVGTDISATYFKISGTTLTDSVSSVTSILYMADEIFVADGATFTVCKDADCEQVYRSKIVELAYGENTFYVKVVNGGDSLVYTVNVYRAKVCTLTFDVDGGSAVDSITVDENTKVSAPETTKKGYTFNGWVMENGDAYDFSIGVADSVALKADWSLDTYTISYDVDGGTLSMANPTEYNVHTDTITLINPTRTGYRFDGWFDGDVKVETIEKGSTGNKSLVAKWTAAYTVSGGTITGLTEYGKSFTNLELPSEIDGVAITAIGAGAFANATFETLTIPASVTAIGAGSCEGCASLQKVYYLGSNANWEAIEQTLPAGDVLLAKVARTGIFVNVESVSVKEDESVTITASALLNGVEQSVQFNWTSNDATIASVVDGEVTGNSGGETFVTVSATIDGTLYEVKVTVSVTGVARTLEVDTTSWTGKVVQQKTVVATAYNDGVAVGSPDLAWTTLDQNVVTVDNGKLTAVGVGKTTVTVTWTVKAGLTKSVNIPVEVTSNLLTLSQKQYVEMGVNDSAWDLSEHKTKLEGFNLTVAKYGSVDVTSAFNASSYAVDKSAFTGATLGETAPIQLNFVNKNDSTDTWVITGNAMVVTQALRDADDIDGFIDVAYAQGGLRGTTGATYGVYDGYFVLANDIDYSASVSASGTAYADYRRYDPTMSYADWTGSFVEATWANGRDYGGFAGTFDGQGYNIDRMMIGGTGQASGAFIGKLNTKGVIKNVSFTNGYHEGWGGFVCATGNGTVQDVYVHLRYQATGGEIDRSGVIFSRDLMAEARVIRVIVKVDGWATDGGECVNPLGTVHLKYGIYQGVYAIGGNTTTPCAVASTGTGQADVYGAYADQAAFTAANIDFSSWTATGFWTLDANGDPVAPINA